VFKLETLQKAVGGWIEVIAPRPGHRLVVCEDGRLKGFPYNPLASILSGDYGPLVGDVVAATPKEVGE